MAPSVLVSESKADFPAKLTRQVLVCTIIAAFGGLMFGYDIGISGGVTSMDNFLIKFFPDVYEQKHTAIENNYCKYDNQKLQLFTSSLYLAAIVASAVATWFCKSFGRKLTIQFASIFFLAGAVLNTVAHNLITLIAGRILLGVGVGFGNTAVPLFISEIAPSRYRGGLNVSFQLLVTVGILGANMVNFFTSRPHLPVSGWRVSLGGAALPALFLLLGSMAINETPTSLVERGQKEKALETLKKIRGVEEVQDEFEAIVRADEAAKQQSESSFVAVGRRPNRPPLIVAVVLQIFQQLTGINVIMFYAPVLFQTIGLGNNASLLSAVVTGSVNVLATTVANFFVDKYGRKVLLVQGAIQMLVSLTGVGVILTTQLNDSNSMSPAYAMATLVLICTFVSGFAWSWGPLGWLIPSEIFPVEARNAGFFFAVGTNMLFTFAIAQAFLTMLCRMKSFIFFFFVGWVVLMLSFAVFLLPETKGVPIDEMADRVWKKHWLWKRFYDDDKSDVNANPSRVSTVVELDIKV